MKTDTIAAIATAMTNSGIGIVRMSGDEAFEIIKASVEALSRFIKGKKKNIFRKKKVTQYIMDIL